MTNEDENHNTDSGDGGSSDEKNTGMAIIAYIIFFIPLLTDAKNDPFVRYHVKQGLLVFIGIIAIWMLPPAPFYFFLFIRWALHVAVIALLIIGIMNAASGEKKPLPVIGEYAEKISL